MAALHDLGSVEEPAASPPPPAATGVRGAATHLGVSPSTVRRMIAAGDLPAVRIGGRVVVRFEDLDGYLADRAAASADTFGRPAHV